MKFLPLVVLSLSVHACFAMFGGGQQTEATGTSALAGLLPMFSDPEGFVKNHQLTVQKLNDAVRAGGDIPQDLLLCLYFTDNATLRAVLSDKALNSQAFELTSDITINTKEGQPDVQVPLALAAQDLLFRALLSQPVDLKSHVDALKPAVMTAIQSLSIGDKMTIGGMNPMGDKEEMGKRLAKEHRPLVNKFLDHIEQEVFTNYNWSTVTERIQIWQSAYGPFDAAMADMQQKLRAKGGMKTILGQVMPLVDEQLAKYKSKIDDSGLRSEVDRAVVMYRKLVEKRIPAYEALLLSSQYMGNPEVSKQVQDITRRSKDDGMVAENLKNLNQTVNKIAQGNSTEPNKALTANLAKEMAGKTDFTKTSKPVDGEKTKSSNLTWLWITLAVVGALIVIAISVWCCMSRSNSEPQHGPGYV